MILLLDRQLFFESVCVENDCMSNFSSTGHDGPRHSQEKPEPASAPVSIFSWFKDNEIEFEINDFPPHLSFTVRMKASVIL